MSFYVNLGGEGGRGRVGYGVSASFSTAEGLMLLGGKLAWMIRLMQEIRVSPLELGSYFFHKNRRVL